ncbi:hypothetical protein PPERSA_08946 [Pseudocohnilembus persalinus]|uniref:Uncharacterized protein n=1 Tax=Pseudocohnilembus persalinus TaxID=266149 RepID=A0A0V0R3A9_PSEPJ|nr:hypothetical protein PPERSA_08946 [Pseudocohnilembus persalinus]|eukprot:KRX08842.1 hypothetical protein PPERSA_08946 [Pseudocohnilembus persalinus]
MNKSNIEIQTEEDLQYISSLNSSINYQDEDTFTKIQKLIERAEEKLLAKEQQFGPTQMKKKVQQRQPKFQGNLGGVLLENENKTAFTEIVYDEQEAVQYNTNENNQKDESHYKKSKYHSSKLLFRKKNYDDRPKLLCHKGTDTNEDFEKAMKDWDYPQKIADIRSIMQDTEQNIKSLEKFIEQQKAEQAQTEYSKVDKTLANVIKLFKQKTFETSTFFAKQDFGKNDNFSEADLEEIKQQLDLEFNDVQKETALVIFNYVNHILSNRELKKTSLQKKKNNIATEKQEKKKIEQEQKKQIENSDDFQKKFKEVQQNYQEIFFKLEKKESLFNDLQASLQNNEQNLAQLRQEVEKKDKQLQKQTNENNQLSLNHYNLSRKIELIQIEKAQIESQLVDYSKKLLQSNQIQSNNKKLQDVIKAINKALKSLKIDQSNQFRRISEHIIDSDMNDTKKLELLKKIQDILLKKDTISDKDRQKMLCQILLILINDILYGKNMDSSFQSLNQNLLNLNSQVFDGAHEIEQPINVVQGKFKQVEIVETTSDGTKITRKLDVFDQQVEKGQVIQNADGTYQEVAGFQKQTVKKKVIQKVQKKRIVKDENGEEKEEDYLTDEEFEVEEEINVPVFKEYKKKRKTKLISKNTSSSNMNQSNQLAGSHKVSISYTNKKKKNTEILRSSKNSNSIGTNNSNNFGRKSQLNINDFKRPSQKRQSSQIQSTSKDKIKKNQSVISLSPKRTNLNKIKEENIQFKNNDNNNITENKKVTKGSAVKQIKVKVQKLNSKGELEETEEIQNQNVEGDILEQEDGKKIIKSTVKKTVTKQRELSDGKIENYEEEIVQDIFYELDEQGNIGKQIEGEDANKIKSDINKLNNKNQSPEKKTVQVKGEVEDYEDEVSIFKDIEINGCQSVDPNTGQEIFEDQNTGQKMKKKIVIETIKKERKNSKGQIEFYNEQVEKEVYSPIIDSPQTKNNKQYLEEFEKQITDEKNMLTNQIEDELFGKPETIITKSPEGKNILVQKSKVIKQRKNKNGEIEQYEEEQSFHIELKDDQTVDDQGNIIDKNTGKLIKTKAQIYNQGKIEKEQKDKNNIIKLKNVDIQTEIQQTQTDFSLLWPLVNQLLNEIGIEQKKVTELFDKYFSPQAKKDDLNKLQVNLSQNSNNITNFINKSDAKINNDLNIESKDINNLNNEKQIKNNQKNNDTENKNNKNNFQKYQNQIQLEQSHTNDELFSAFEDNNYFNQNQKQKDEEIFNRNLNVLEDKVLLLEPTIKKLYAQIRQAKDKYSQDVRQKIRKYYNKQGDGYLAYDEFKNYYIKFMTVHNRCGDFCIHLQRFFAQIGFTTSGILRRKQLKPHIQNPSPFNK